MKWCAIFLCSCFIAVVNASGNLLKDPYICGPPTCTPSEKFNYLSQVVYHYRYNVNVNTWFAGSSNNQSTLTVKSAVSIQFITPCEGLLQLSDVTLQDQDESYPVERAEKFIHALGEYPLKFAFHDGVISEICPEQPEEDWVLNFKRAILSLYQNTMKRFDINFKGVERDIHGSCNVDYKVRGQEDTSLIVVKSRDLAQCTDRYKYMSILQTVRYNFQSKFQTWPVLTSESKCRISVDNKIYKTVNCKERHLFEPFSGKQSGAMTTVVQDLVLTEEQDKTDTQVMDEQPKVWNAITLRSNLLHHHTPYYRASTGELKSARDVLKLLCNIKEAEDDGGPASTVDENLDSGSTVGLWGSLVRASRGLDHPTLSQLLARAPTICKKATEHILDALPYIASVGSVELIKDMIIRGTVDEETKHEWLMSMAMIPRPKLPMLGTMLELLQKYKNDRVISFTASSMVHSYCKHSGKPLRECCEENGPKDIMVIFENIVTEMKQNGLQNVSRTDRNTLLIGIKALGNIGGFKQEFADILIDIIGDNTLPVPVRLTAIDAFRKTPCIETREYFLELYREDLVDIEVRLAAYLQVMRCPNLSTIRKIFHALKHETVNQAATFVWSHLNNLGQSSLPSRVEIQGLLSGNTVPQLEDNPDFRIFSRNYEQSVFFDQYNAGGNYEANVIFSPNSYIPRSVSLNLTVDMFGESINVFEMKARGEGFEKYFEQIFGGYGPLSKDKLNDQLQNLRVFRSTNDADEAREKIDRLGYKNEALKHQFPMAEMGIKVFGNEISYWSAEGDDEIKKSLSKLNPQLRILEILSGKEIRYNKASLFLDTTYAVPTGCGLPLAMNLMGTSYVNMKMAGTVVDKFSATGNLDFEGKIHPSVALNVAATMGVIAGTLSSTGIRLNMRLYTATAVEAKLKLQGLKLVHLDLSLPHSKQEIFGAKSELIILHGDQEHQQMGLNRNRIEQNTCSWSTFDTAIGIKVCAAYQFPNMTNLHNAPYFLMSGPAKYLISLEKADPSAKTYSFHYTWDENDTNSKISFSFDTPNSKEKRMFNAQLHLSQNDSTALVTFESARSTLTAHGRYRNLECDKSLEASLDVDGRKHFDTVVSLVRHDVRLGHVWIPHAYLVVNDERIAELSGSLKVKSKGGVTQWDIQADFQTKQLASRLVGYYTINGPTHGTKLQLDYQFYKNAKQTVKLEGLYSERAAGYRHDLYGELGMEFSAYPIYDFYAVLSNVKSQSHVDVSFNVSNSRLLRDEPKFSFTFIRMENLNSMKVSTQVLMTKPTPLKLQLKYQQTGSKYSALALLNVNPRARDIMFAGFLYKPPGTQLYLDGSLNVTLPTLQHPMSVTVKVHEKAANEFQVNAVGVWFTNMDFNIDALYQDQSKTNMASHRLKILINSSHFKDIAADARFTQDNRQITFIGEGEYNEGKYRTLLRYILLSEQNFTTYAEVDINGKAYTVNLNADLNNNTIVNMDIHIDQWRDLHLSYQRWVSARRRRLSAALNWDANRDPSQRISLDVELERRAALHHAGHLALYYPGRLLNGEFEVLLKDWFCEWSVKMGWSPEDVMQWRVKMYSEAHEQTVYALLSNMDTPFPGWQDTSFNLMWRYHDNLQAINGSMNWQEDYLAFSLLADYLFRTNEFYGEINAVVNSTIPTLPKAAAIAKHRVFWKKSADTLLSFQYNDDGVLMINSSWLLDRGHRNDTITGRVTLATPFQGYKNGFLRTKFVFGDRRDINGVTFVDLEDKVLKINVNGHMRRITNSMLVVNVTSPVSEYSHMVARIGFVEADRHMVAMVVTPNSTTGVEILLKLQSIQDFHVYGHVALPIQYLTRAMVTAKRSREEVDFRVGWGPMNFGFTGIWQYRSPINFVYLYKLYTPLEGFEENGFVLKNVYGNGLDTELSVRLSKHKFGVAVLLKDNGKGFLEVITETLRREKIDTDMLLENFDTTASVTLDTLYYPTITFDAHFIKFLGADEEDIIEANATLNLPDKPPIILTDVFILEQYTVMRNTLHIVTPFQAIQELKSVYTVDIVIGEKFNITCLVLLYNGEKWHEISGKVYYEYESGADDAYQSYIASLGVVTPLRVLPALSGAVTVRLEDALWKMAADVAMPAFTINAVGSLELDDPFVETSGSLNLTSLYLDDYFIKMEFKKDFSDIENTLGGGIQVRQGDQNNYMFADATWRPAPSQHMRVSARAALSPVLAESRAQVVYAHDHSDGFRSIAVGLELGENGTYSLSAERRSDTATMTLSSPVKGFNHMKVDLEFTDDDIRGTMFSDGLECRINGKVLNRKPFDISLELIPKGEADRINIRMKCDITETSYIIFAHFMGTIHFTLNAVAEIEKNFTDINFKIDSPQIKNKDIYFKARIDSYPDLRRVVTVQASTPFQKLQHIKGDTDFVFGPKTGYVICKYDMPDMKGDGDLKWSFTMGDLYIKALGHQQVRKMPRSVDLDIYFGNDTGKDGLQSTNAGFRMDLDSIWQIGANASIGYIIDKRIALIINAILPKPNVDVHTLRVNGDIGSSDNPLKSLDVSYSTDVTKITTAVKGKVMILPDSFRGNASVIWTSNGANHAVDNIFYTDWNENGSHSIDYALTTPIYLDQETFKIKGSYDKDFVHNLKIVKGVMHRPGTSQIGEIDIKYGGTMNTKGHFNVTTPFQNLLWLKSIFDIKNGDESSINKVELFWPNKTASLNTTHHYKKVDSVFSQTGDISLEIPLNRKHSVSTEYYYLQSDKWSRGNATIDFDGDRFVKGSFRQVLSTSERNLELATTDIEVENVHTPVGIKYIHEFDGTGNVDAKQATIFHLYNASHFNVTGKVDLHSWDTGKNLKLTAIHGNRTLTFENDYEAKDKDLTQGSKMKWAQDVWINYNIHVTNMTTDEAESQQIVINVWYPLRTFNLVALYNLQDTSLDGKARLNWNVKEQNKTAELKGRWDNPAMADANIHNVDLSLSHPSFNKDVTLKGQYMSTPSVMSNVSLELQYSEYDTEHLKFMSLLTDNSNGPIRDYKFGLTCVHPATNLDLEMRSDVNIHSHWYMLDNYYRLQKSLFYQKLRHTKVLIDTSQSLVKYERVNETDQFKVNGTWDLTYPDYKVLTWVNRTSGNDTGIAVLSMKDKSFVAHFNSTDDISYHMIGMIVDTRSAKLNAWRDYDDVTTVDLASYIRLNHSRLLTSSVVWRPQIFGEVKSQGMATLKHIYGQVNETLVILKEAPMEAHLALRSIWADAKPRIRDFLDDLNDLHVIKDDLDNFQLFLNASYESNDFYVKDMVEFVYHVLDEMAIRNHLESLPGILNDMWGLMGNTGKSLKQSLTYVVETIKQAYSNFVASVNRVLEADFMELLSERLESVIMQYDNFVRDLHIKLLHYWEITWVNAMARLNKYWHELLKSTEPMIVRILHFFETILITTWKSVMDFFYNRTQELTDSPYFNYVATFGQEMDHLYKDIVNNDLITNIKKYTKKLWNAIWVKIEDYIPFKYEAISLYNEFKSAWENFLKNPQVKFLTDKYKEARDRLKWWYNYFLIGEALDKVWEILYAKLTEMTKTALVYEEEHRTPKTNFIFDPRQGEIVLEQKLPMSWHAFNRTPDFTEIAEYKAVRDFLDEWLTTNKSVWSYYYELRPYMDLNNVLPPFGGLAMMTGQGTIVTYDKRVFTISEAGTFLLTRDYKQNNFTILMESNDQGRYNLIVLTKKNLIHIDLYREQVSTGGTSSLTLPATIDGCVIDRDLDTVSVQGQTGVDIQCNFLFKTCKLQISGWYYASVGGLFGTFNNEQCDDMQSKDNKLTENVSELGQSWNLDGGTAGLVPVENHETKNDMQCDKFFQNKVSPLHPCFSVIDVSPFYEECISGVEACALASTYLEMCSQEHIPIHIPEQCVQCTTPQGDTIEEGSFYQLKYVPSSQDVVFVMEAQYCNKNIRKAKNMDIFIEAFDSRLQLSGLSDNRYAIVGFGGSGVYKKPRSLYVNNKVFTNAIEIVHHFDNFDIEKRDLSRRNDSQRRADMFEALSYASTLPFRAGVPRTLLLLPCSKCDVAFMRLDYSTIHQNLVDNSITLHILMDDNLVLSKKRVAKYLFGIDNAAAYTNKDYENLVGDTALRKQVKLPKEKLGLCTSLAMETNGSIFSGKKLSEQKSTARRLSTVLGARAAVSARPCAQPPHCECREARLACRPCADTQRLLSELSSFWNADDIDDIIDMAMDPPILPSLR